MPGLAPSSVRSIEYDIHTFTFTQKCPHALWSNQNTLFLLCCLTMQSGRKLFINRSDICSGLTHTYEHFLKTTWRQSANFEVDGIPFSGKPSDASGLLETHSHPLRQTLINLCVQVWISQLNLWHTALPEHRLCKCPPLTDKGCIKTRLAACHCLLCSSYWKGLQGSEPKRPFSGPESSTWAFRLEAKGQLVVRL